MLRNTVKGACKVLINGSERVAYLSKLLNREVCIVDLDTIGCPRACEWPPHPPPDRDEIDGPWPQNLGKYPYEMRLKLLLHCPHWQHQYLAEQACNACFKCALKQALTYRDWYKQRNRTPANRPISFSSSDDEDDDEVVVPSPITTTTTVNDDTNDESDNGCKSSGFCFGGCSYVKCK